MAFSRNSMVLGYALVRPAEIQIFSIGEVPEAGGTNAGEKRVQRGAGAAKTPFFR
jgi:hypothetical protein